MQFHDEQSASRIELAGGTILTKCDQCEEAHAERNPPEDPPCETCFVELLPANDEAARIFLLVRHQLIMGPMSPIDINHLAIHAAMDLYKVQDRRKCFEAVLRVSGWWLGRLNKKEK